MEPNKLNFSPTPKEMFSQFESSKKEAENSFKKLLEVPEAKRDSKNTLIFFENILSQLGDELGIFSFLGQVSPNKEIREASQKISEALSKYTIDIFTREELYSAIISIKDGGILRGDETKLFRKVLYSFKTSGLELPKDKREELKKIHEKLSELGIKFRKNIADYKDSIEVSKEQLNGLSEDYISGLKKTKEEKYQITLDYPTYFGFMRGAEDDKSREKLEFKFKNRPGKENRAILNEMVALRAASAKLLNYKSHANLVLEEKMAKDPSKVLKFLEELEKGLKVKGQSEFNELLELKKKHKKDGDVVLNSWDTAFYTNLLKKNKYGIDSEKIKEFFPIDKVIEGTFKIYELLLGIKIDTIDGAKSWHEDVKAYSVSDSSSGNLKGYFYLDLHPRDGKFTHAAVMRFIDGRMLKNGTYQKCIASMVANFAKPTKNKPALLIHSDVETFFHEFGHMVHDMLSTSKYGWFSATAGVSRDFVEAPSQMLENWMWNKESIKFVSSHYKTKESIPDQILDNMISFKEFCALNYLRQILFARFDMILYTQGGDVDTLFSDLSKKMILVPQHPGTYEIANFAHVASGYDAQYYGYLWSEVYAADMFSRFEKEGVLNPKVGMDYRKFILEPVIMYEEEKQVEKFLGRKPNDKAFLKSLGIK